jgi:4-amino-4-deoxy-L-arabinose transferase-like glycosyltransferase
VSESPTAITEKTQSSPLARIGWAVLIVATLYVCYFSHLGAIGFVGPDEPRYAWIARDMAETGDWVTPRLYGKPWFEKPPLFYWGAALSFKLFGVSEASARLPSAISALLATLALAWLALRLYGAETARWLLLLLPTTVGMIGFSHAAATDMPFSGMLTIAMACAAVVLGLTRNENTPILPRTPWFALILFGFFLGLAVLAKGPAAIILSGGAVFFWALFTKRWPDAFRLFHPAAIAAFCLTALPWYILCAHRNPDFFRIFIIEHNFKRFLTPEFQHIQPFWYYGPILLLALFPWIGMTLSAVLNSLRQKFEMKLDSTVVFFLTFSAFPVIFFSISRSKLPGYVLPAIPAFAFLTAYALASALRMEKVPVPAGFAVLALTPVALMATLGLSIYFLRKPEPLHPFAVSLCLLSFLAVSTALVFAFSRMHRATLVAGILAWVCFVGLTNHFAMSWLDPQVSARPVARSILRNPEISSGVKVFQVQRGRQYALNFYLNRELKEWSPSEAEDQYVVSSVRGILELREKRIPYELVDDSCMDAILVRVSPTVAGNQESVSSRIIKRPASVGEVPKAYRAGVPVAGNRSKKKLTTRFS